MKIRNKRYYLHRIALEKLKQKTWIFLMTSAA